MTPGMLAPVVEKPTGHFARKVKEAADQNRTGGDSKWQGVDTFLEYVKLLRGQGHYVYIGRSDAAEMKAVWRKRSSTSRKIVGWPLKCSISTHKCLLY